MAEEVLGVFPCIVRKQATSLYITTDRIIFHTLGTGAQEAQVVLLNTVLGFIMNKPRPELPPHEQKSLIKIQYRDPESGEQRDRVIDFTGDDRFANVIACESLLRLHAGDKAEERRMRIKQEAERLSAARTRFLADNPDVHTMFDYLTSPEGGGLSSEEFWDQYKDQLLDVSVSTDSNFSTSATGGLPAPLRRPDLIQNDISANLLVQSADRKNELNITPEKAAEIFAQFPKAKQLFDQLVPAAVSEKNFWKRFFQSQYFNLSQGHAVSATNSGIKADTVFDTLTISTPGTSQFQRPGEIPVDPEIDLSTDWFLAETGVFTFRESGSDGAQKVENSGRMPAKESTAHATLVRRFNEYSSKNLQAIPEVSAAGPEDPLVVALRKRRELIDREIETQIAERNLPPTEMEDGSVVSKFEIEKLRRTRAVVPDAVPWSQEMGGEGKGVQIRPGIEGVANATIELTTELVLPFTAHGTAEVSRRVKKISQTEESHQLTEYMDRVCELLRFFYAAKLDEKEKRNKLIFNLNKIKNEINNSFIPKARFPNDWMGTIGMINGMVSNAEIINANLG